MFWEVGSLLCCVVYRFVDRDANVTEDPDENDLYGVRYECARLYCVVGSYLKLTEER